MGSRTRVPTRTGRDQDASDQDVGQDEEIRNEFGSNSSQQDAVGSSGPPPSGGGGAGEPPPLTPEQEAAKTQLTNDIITRAQGRVNRMWFDIRDRLDRETDEDVRLAVWYDQDFRTDPVWGNAGHILSSVLTAVSPIEDFRRSLQTAHFQRGQDGDVLQTVRDWVSENAGLCEAAVSAGLLDVVGSYLEGESEYEAICLLLFAGTMPTGPRADMERAIAASDAERFIAAWSVFASDPASVTQIATDPNWLTDVQNTLGEAVYQQVMADIRSVSNDTALAGIEGELVPYAAACCSTLEELNNFWLVRDNVVLGGLRAYFSRVDGLITAHQLPDELHEQVKNLARTMLVDMWNDFHSTTLSSKITAGVQGQARTDALDLLELQETSDAGEAQLPEGPAVDHEAMNREILEAAREHAGAVRSETNATFYVSDSGFIDKLETANTAMRAIVQPYSANVAEENANTLSAMRTLRDTYDQQFSRSLVNDLHNYVQDDALCRRGLTLIGDRIDPNARVAEEQLGQVEAEEMDDANGRLIELNEEMMSLAESFHDQMVDVWWVSDANVLGLCSDFVTLKGTFSDLADTVDGWVDRNFTDRLESAYRSIGGDLRHGISNGLDPDNADTAFQRLGLTGRIEAMREDGDARSAELIATRETAESNAQDLFEAIEGIRVVTASSDPEREDQESQRERDIRGVARLLGRFATAKSAYDAQLVADGADAIDIYRDYCGINLSQHLSLKLETEAECDEVRDQLPEGSGPVSPMSDSPRDVTLDPDDPGLAYDPAQIMQWDFSLEQAEERARELHDRATNDGITTFNLTETGSPEENRVILEIFRRLYGYDFAFLIRQNQGFGTGAAENMEIFAEGAGQMETSLQELETRVNSNDSERVVNWVMNATRAEHEALLADGELLHEIRSSFGQETYDHVYRAATGQLTMGDILRENDAGWFSWMGVNWGSDEEGAQEGVTSFVQYVKGRFERGELEQMPATEQDLLRQLFTDREAQAVMAQEFGGTDLLHLRQLVLGGGERSTDDQLAEGMMNATRGRDLLDMISNLTLEERQARLRDVRFMQQLTTLLTTAQMSQAMGILTAEPGEEYDYQLSQAVGEQGTFDQDAMMDTLLSMPAEALYRQSRDRRWVSSTRRRLRRRDEKEVFDHLMQQAELLFAPSEDQGQAQDESVVDDPLAMTCDEPVMTEAQKETQRQLLMLRHSTAINFAATRATARLYPALQAAFNERGEITPDPSNPEAKEQIFGDTEREALWNEHGVESQISAQYGADSEMYTLVEDVLTRGEDPSEEALEYAFGIWGADEELVNAAIDGTSNQVLINQWSNIKGPGETTGGTSLEDVYNDYQPVRERWLAAGGSVENMCIDPELQDEYVRQLVRFRNFPLDVSTELAEVLRNDTFWTNVTLSWTSQREFLDFKMKARAKIVNIPGSEIATALGIDAEDPVAEMLNGVDRKARSIQSHQRDAARHQLDQPSVADYFSDTDEQLAVSWALYSGEVGAAGTAQDGEMVGEITEEEQERIQERLDQFNVDIAEYRAAKDTTAEVLKWTAVLIIGAVATALTGPGGPGLVAAMVTAGVQATTVALIQEAAQGNDYDFSRDGTRSIIMETAMAGLQVKGAEIFQKAAQNWGPAQRVMGAMERWNQLSSEFDGALTQAFGPAGNVIWDSGVAATRGQLSSLGDAAFAMIDPSNLQYGWDYGMLQSESQFEAALEGMPDAFWESFKEELFKNTAAAIQEGLEGEDASMLPGTEELAAERTPEAESLLQWMAGNARDDLIEQVIEEGATRFGDGSMFRADGWDDDQVGDFLLTFARGQAEDLVSHVAEGIRDDLNSPEVERRRAEVRAMADNDEEAAAMLEMYNAHLRAHTEGTPEFDLTPERWAAIYWEPVQRDMRANLDGAEGPLVDEYRRWVMSDPAQASSRSRTSFDDFQRQHRVAGNMAITIRASAEYRDLSHEQREYYDAYMSDTLRMMDMAGQYANQGLDIRNAEARARFESSFQATKRAIAEPILESITADWPERDRQAIDRIIATADIEGIPALELRADSPQNRERLAAWAERMRRARRNPPQRQEVHGEFI